MAIGPGRLDDQGKKVPFEIKANDRLRGGKYSEMEIKLDGKERGIMNFTDPQLQKCYENRFADLPELRGDERQISALIAAYDLFEMLEGPHSSRVHELRDHLLRPELRPGLRRWYQRADANWDRAAVELRDQLSRLAGEKFEPAADVSHKPILSA